MDEDKWSKNCGWYLIVIYTVRYINWRGDRWEKLPCFKRNYISSFISWSIFSSYVMFVYWSVSKTIPLRSLTYCSPWKVTGTQKERIVSQPSWLSGVNELLNFGGVQDNNKFDTWWVLASTKGSMISFESHAWLIVNGFIGIICLM